jgi:serine/threonine protein kinase
MSNLVGKQLGNYRLISSLGRGGFAEVYLGEHLRIKNLRAAIKVLHTHLVHEEIEQFQQEASLIAGLVHPNIVRVLDFDVADGTPFLVLDYAPHGSLRKLYPRGIRLPLESVLSFVQQVADALQLAHDQRLIHRDVKPENMLLGARNEVLLSDFGIATIAHSTSSMNIEATMGTFAYMAPEQIQGKPRPASDQYALGVTVYQWLTGTMPFQGSTTEIIAQHLTILPPPLRSHRPELAPDVEHVALTALAKDPKQRFASVKAFAVALHAATRLPGHQSELVVPPTILPQPAPLAPTLPATPPQTPPIEGSRRPPQPSESSGERQTPSMEWSDEQPWWYAKGRKTPPPAPHQVKKARSGSSIQWPD